jgi:hypothetical protein
MRPHPASALLCALLAGCFHRPSPGDAQACELSKLAFTRETGCRNDGALELCLPREDAALLAEAQALAPGLRAIEGRGRAGCALDTEQLYQLPVGEAECTARHGALREEAWLQVCGLSRLAQVRAIVPTWYE